jgi:hypothetical protein
MGGKEGGQHNIIRNMAHLQKCRKLFLLVRKLHSNKKITDKTIIKARQYFFTGTWRN